jgi:hypothetical protein
MPLPICRKLSTEAREPKRAADRTESDEPKSASPSTLIEPTTRTPPVIETEELNRAKLLTLVLDPRLHISRTLQRLPKRELLRTDMLEATCVNSITLTLNADEQAQKPTQLKPLPTRAKLRIE